MARTLCGGELGHGLDTDMRRRGGRQHVLPSGQHGRAGNANTLCRDLSSLANGCLLARGLLCFSIVLHLR